MTRFVFTFFALLCLLTFHTQGTTWEKLYINAGADAFRDVYELSNGDYMATGYTDLLNGSDTDGLAIRYNSNGGKLWTYIYNGPANSADGFYRGVPTADGGFILCGFTRDSTTTWDDALYVKVDSAGNYQWSVKWGGTGFERARDIIETPTGNFVSIGYTNSAPAQNYDMFMLKLDPNGNLLWNKLYGDTGYDEANTVLRLPDGGYMVGGMGDSDLYMVRTDAGGNEEWSKHLGTSGVDLCKSIVFAPGGNGYAIAGTTTGIGAGSEDAYLVRTDTAGNILWFQTYGGPLDDGFQRIATTSDGSYLGIGTSRLGLYLNPNMWISKIDSSGNIIWQKYYGGDEHDHGYSARETSDGGYVAVGHTRSFGLFIPPTDAYIVKTDANGNVQNRLIFTAVSFLISPDNSHCGSQTMQITVKAFNFSDTTVQNIPVTVDITGAITQTLTQTYSSPVLRMDSAIITFNTTVDMSASGTYNFHCYSNTANDVYPNRSGIYRTIVINGIVTANPVVTDGSHCGPGSISLSATSPNTVQWYDSLGGTLLSTGQNFTTPVISSTIIYYASAGSTCPSPLVAVTATINPLPVVNLGPDTLYTSQTSVLLDAGGNSSYLWSNGNTMQTINVTTTDNYCVTVTDANSCSNSDCIYVEFSNGIDEYTSAGINIYPQPSRGMISLITPSAFSNYNFSLIDVTGKSVFNRILSGGKETFDISTLPAGIYFARIEGSEKLFSGKVVVEY